MRFLKQINERDEHSRVLFLWVVSFTTIFFQGKIPFVLHAGVLSTVINTYLILKAYNLKFGRLLTSAIDFSKKTYHFLLLLSVFIAIFLFYGNLHEIILKEIIYAIYVLILLFQFFLIKDNIDFSRFFRVFSKVFLFLIAILIVGLYYSLLIKGNWDGKVFNIKVDYNFLCLTLIFGFLILFFPTFNNSNKFTSFLIALFAFLITIQIFFSASRRGIVIFIILNCGIILYQLINRKVKRKHKSIKYYYSIILLVLSISLIIFQFSGKALRIKAVDYIFDSESTLVKARIASLYNRYGTIFNDSVINYSQTYKQLWEPEKFPEISFIDGLYGKNLKKKLWESYKEEEYGDTWSSLCDLAYFSPYNRFKKELPAIYTDIIPDKLFQSDSLEKIPYILPLPFIEKEFLSVYGLDNLFLINYPEKSKDVNYFRFIRKNEGYGYFTAILPDVIDAQYQIPLFLKGVSEENLKIELLNRDNIVLKDILIKTYPTDNNFEVYKVIFDNNDQDGLKLKFSVYLKESDTLTILDPQIIRTPLLENSVELNESVLDNYYLNRKQIRNKYHLLFFNRYINSDLAKLSAEEVEQLNFFIDNQYTFFKPEFRNYGELSIQKEELYDDSLYSFYSTEDNIHARAYSILTAIPGITYHLKFNVTSPKKPDIKLKRYPEISGHFLIDSVIEKNIKKENDVYQIDFAYKVINSSSCKAALIVGIKDAEMGMEFSISDIDIECINKDNNINITRYNYNRLKSKIELTYKRSIQENIVINNKKVRQIKQNLKNGKEGFIDSRWLRWKIAYYLFEERNGLQKIFGNGFGYLEIYNNVFQPGEVKRYDYPHDPVIS